MITTERLYLRKFIPGDWERAHLYASDPVFSQYEVWGPNSEEETKKYVADCIEQTSQDPIQDYVLAVTLRSNDEMIGGCGLKTIGEDQGEASLGWGINPDYQSRGYATECAIALIDFGFQELQLNRIIAECNTANTASRRVMEKSGMRLAETIVDHREVKGAMTDSFRFDIYRPA